MNAKASSTIDISKDYHTEGIYDEMMNEKGEIRPVYRRFIEHLKSMNMEQLRHRQHSAERSLLAHGMTFNVYGKDGGVERIFPFDIIPRIIAQKEWAKVERGLTQRITALNMFINDLYGEQKILKDNIIPREVLDSSQNYLKACQGLKPPRKIWAHISGIDLIRDERGRYLVLEDNLRVPSGVSYVLGNRDIMKSTFPRFFRECKIAPVYDYPLNLLEMLQGLSRKSKPVVAVLTPGIYNSAYFEHSFLAQQMGVYLIEGRDLVVENDNVYMRTVLGPKKVDVIYRRVDDTFIDPEVFNKYSLLGVRGLMRAYAKGNVAIANAPGTGVADDKVIYAYIPKVIKYYLDEDPVLSNVPTYLCFDDKQRQHVLENIAEMVVKPANESGGYGLLIGTKASKKELKDFKERINNNPRNYIAQPVVSFSQAPTIIGEKIEGRHVDLRPFIIQGETTRVLPGGLSRVALQKGQLVVNSSQGGGSKDTWVLQSGRLD